MKLNQSGYTRVGKKLLELAMKVSSFLKRNTTVYN